MRLVHAVSAKMSSNALTTCVVVFFITLLTSFCDRKKFYSLN